MPERSHEVVLLDAAGAVRIRLDEHAPELLRHPLPRVDLVAELRYHLVEVGVREGVLALLLVIGGEEVRLPELEEPSDHHAEHGNQCIRVR